MRYVNTKNGAIVDSPFNITGGNWIEEPEVTEEIEEIEETKAKEPIEKPQVKKTEADGIDGVTVDDIKQELDALGIKYDKKARKKELYDLMIGA